MADVPTRAGVAGTYLQTVAYSYGASQGQGSAWFGPSAPMAPSAPADVAGRQFDYPVGYNLNTRPRVYEPIGFRDLRALADGYDLLRLAIETRKDQLSRMSWSIKSRDSEAKDKDDPRVKAITTFLQRPDGEHGWQDWLRPILEDLFVIDAPALYLRRDRGGRLIELVQIDGATIKPVIDDWGRTPRPYSIGSDVTYPSAYQQILKGLPAVDYSTRDLLYRPRNRRIHTPYGFGPVEQIVTTVNIALRRQLSTLSYFTEGNIPDMMVQVPPTWTPDQIVTYQQHWDAYFSGDLGRRRRAKFVPGGTGAGGIHETRQADLKGDFDEWLAKLICFAFSISPQALTKQMNRASADTQKQLSEEEGLEPVLLWIKALIDDVIAFEFDAPDLAFTWDNDDEADETAQLAVLSGYVSKAIMTVNEARDRLGLDPLPDPEASQGMIITGSGAVPLGSFQQQQDQSAANAKIMADAAAKQPQAALGPDGKAAQQIESLSAEKVAKANPNHDERGRFASGSGKGGAYTAADTGKVAIAIAGGIAGLHALGWLAHAPVAADPKDGVVTTYESHLGAAKSVLKTIRKTIVPDSLKTYQDYLDAEAAHYASTVGADTSGAKLRMVNAVRYTAAKVVHDSTVQAISQIGDHLSVRAGQAAGLSVRHGEVKPSKTTEAVMKAASAVVNGIFRTARAYKAVSSGEFQHAEVAKLVCPIAGMCLDCALANIDDSLDGDHFSAMIAEASDVMHQEIAVEAGMHKAYSADEARNGHGEWTAGGETGAKGYSAEDLAAAKDAAFGVAKGVALVAAASLAVALAPEVGAVTVVASAATYAADGAFYDAGLKSAKVILQHLGVDTAEIEERVKGLVGLGKADASTALTSTLRTMLGEVSDHVRDEMIANVEGRHRDATNLAEVVAAIKASCEAYKAKLAGLSKRYTLGKRRLGTAWRSPEPIPFDRLATAKAEAAIGGRLTKALATIGVEVAKALRKAEKVAKASPDDSDPDEDDRVRRRADDIVNEFDLGSLYAEAEPIGANLEDVVTDTVARAVAQVGPDDSAGFVNQVNARAVAIARERAAELVGMHFDADGKLVPSDDAEMAITDSTRDMLRATIADDLAAGKTTDEIADDIAQHYAFSPERAAVIAATEVSRANSMAAQESYQAAADAGVPVKKRWLAEADCCDVCSANQAAGAIDLDDTFPSGDDTPPGHPNCRCSLTPVVGEPDQTDDE